MFPPTGHIFPENLFTFGMEKGLQGFTFTSGHVFLVFTYVSIISRSKTTLIISCVGGKGTNRLT